MAWIKTQTGRLLNTDRIEQIRVNEIDYEDEFAIEAIYPDGTCIPIFRSKEGNDVEKVMHHIQFILKAKEADGRL